MTIEGLLVHHREVRLDLQSDLARDEQPDGSLREPEDRRPRRSNELHESRAGIRVI